VWETNLKNKNLAMMSVDELWTLHEEVRTTLSTKLDAEKRELERRMALLNRRARGELRTDPTRRFVQNIATRRGPPRLGPDEAGAQLRSGKKIDDLLIAWTH
jgi:DNA-binding protein H-NS